MESLKQHIVNFVLRFWRSRIVFIVLCLIISATLSFQTGNGWISLGLYGLSLVMVVITAFLVHYLNVNPQHRRWLVPLGIAILVGVLIFSRFGRLQILIFGTTISRFGEWVGLSYLIFRLIHLLVDSRQITEASTGDLAAYALFPAALVAGPIHRANQFLPQLAAPRRPASRDDLVNSLWRIGMGGVKKLVLANGLSLIALNSAIATNPTLPRSILWMSLMAYTFMLYFDFSGYTDIAIGAAGLVGIKLPENFANPYAQPSIARFWQTWHMSLSFWLRDYLYFPISRAMLGRFGRERSTVIMLITHLTTMTIAGLWHGFGTGFLAWGVWHGMGLFTHAQFDKWLRERGWTLSPLIGVALTFAFVMIGWVFFALPDVGSGLRFLIRLVTG